MTVTRDSVLRELLGGLWHTTHPDRFEMILRSAAILGAGLAASVDTVPQMAGFASVGSVDTSTEMAGFAARSPGRPRPRTGFPAARKQPPAVARSTPVASAIRPGGLCDVLAFFGPIVTGKWRPNRVTVHQHTPRKPKSAEHVWTMRKNGTYDDAKLLGQGEFGWECQFYDGGELLHSRRWTTQSSAMAEAEETGLIQTSLSAVRV